MTLEMPENTTVLSLLEHLNLDPNLVKVAVNGQIVAAILHVDKNAFYLPLSIETKTQVLYRPSWFLSKP